MKSLLMFASILLLGASIFSFNVLPAKAVTASVPKWNVAHYNCGRFSGRCTFSYYTQNYPGGRIWYVPTLVQQHWYWGF